MSELAPAVVDERTLHRRGLIATAVGYWFVSVGPVIVASAEVGGLAMGWWRACLGTMVLAAVVARRGQMSWVIVKQTLIPGFCFGFATSFYFWANQITSVVNASLISALQPLLMIICAGVIFGEVLTRNDIGWGAAAFGGAAGLALAGDSAGGGDLGGDALALVAITVGSVYFVYAKKVLQRLDVPSFMLGVFGWAALSMTPVVFLSGQAVIPAAGGDWIRVGAIGLLPGVGHLCLNYAQGKAPFKMMGLIQLLMPVSSTLLALWFLDQPVSANQAIAMCVVIVSLGALTLTRDSKAPAAD